jgi:hypothetical protein
MPYRDRQAQREYQRRWCAERRAEFFADKTCAWCGTAERLELHHADPGKKVSHAIWSWGRERRLNEIAKCVVICRGCHERAHSEARRVEAELRHPCGTVQSYKRGCRCDLCRRGNRDYQRARKARALARAEARDD